MARTLFCLGTSTRNPLIEHPISSYVDKPVSMRTIAGQQKPLDPRKSTLAKLPEDIMILILEFVQHSSPDAMRSIAAVNSILHGMVRYLQLHTVRIDLDQHNPRIEFVQSLQGLRRRIDLLSKEAPLYAVRVFEIHGSTPLHFQPQEKELWDEISQLLGILMQQMTGLREFHWHVQSKWTVFDHTYYSIKATAPIPTSVLELLDSRVHLHTSILCRDSSEFHVQARECLARLSGNPNLWSLNIKVYYRDWQECRKTMSALKRVLLSCPNLTHVPMLIVTWPYEEPYRRYWEGPIFGEPYCGIGLSGSEKPPALKEVGLGRYSCGRKYNGPLPSLQDIRYPGTGTEENYWATNFDWSQLITLRCIPSDLAVEIASRLTSLKELIVTDENYPSKTTTILENIPLALELISLPCWQPLKGNLDVIIRHGHELRKLSIHQPQLTQDCPIANKDLCTLADGLPHLQEFHVDIARDTINNDWPWTTLEIISRFPQLKVVGLWFDLKEDHTQLPTPSLTLSAVRHINSYLYEHNNGLRQVRLGSRTTCIRHLQARDPSGPFWATENSLEYIWDRTAPGHMGDHLTVTSPALSKAENKEFMALLGKSRQKWQTLPHDKVTLAVRIAQEGGLNYQDWAHWHEGWYREEAPRKQSSKTPRLRRLAWRALLCFKT